MEKESTEALIEGTTGILVNLGSIVKVFFKEMKKEFLQLRQIFAANIKEKKGTKFVATIIVISLIVIPMIYQYFQIIKSAYYKITDFWYHDEIMAEIQQTHENSVKNFFDTFNKKYGIDCDWIREVKVDINMFTVYGSTKKPGKGCIVEDKVKIFPVSFDKLEEGGDQVRTSGKGIFLITDKDNNFIQVCYVRYNIWKQKNWSQGYRKINPFENKVCYPEKI